MHTGFGVGTRKRSLERPRRRGEDNIKVDFKVIELDGTSVSEYEDTATNFLLHAMRGNS
jgi:hypothetical protein